jgi:hypothetical protein
VSEIVERLTCSAILAEVADSDAATTVRERNRRVFASPFGAVYDFYIRRERLAQLIARFAWHSDVRPFFASMAAITTLEGLFPGARPRGVSAPPGPLMSCRSGQLNGACGHPSRLRGDPASREGPQACCADQRFPSTEAVFTPNSIRVAR